jgi:mannose-6-phosphate isomerase-like protein (cupin superfamily)
MRFCILVLAWSTWLSAADPDGFGHWKGSELRSFDKKLATKLDADKFGSQVLGSYGHYSLIVAHRERSGEAELHETQTDIFIVQNGEAVLVVGGTVVDPKAVAPHEVGGPSIKDGVERRIGPGDVVHIPAGTPHQLVISPGNHITYAVVKVDTP